jgi:hypothetical protein
MLAAVDAVDAAAATQPSADAALPVDEAQEEQLLHIAGEGFDLKRTPHFLLVYNTSEGLAHSMASRLEDTYRSIYRFLEFNGIDSHRPDQRLEVLLFEQRAEYDDYGRSLGFNAAGTFGVYHETSNRSAFFNVHTDPQFERLSAEILSARQNLTDLQERVNAIRGNTARVEIVYGDGRRVTLTKVQARRELESAQRELKVLDGRRSNYSDRINRTVVQHEAAHHVLFNAGVHPRQAPSPKWIVEGLACLFETPPGQGGTGVAAINQLRLNDFREAVDGGEKKRLLTGDDFLRAIREKRLPSPEMLLGGPQLFELRSDSERAAGYALAWSLTHYLQRREGKDLAEYLRAISRRGPGARSSPQEELGLFEKHFGPLDDSFLRQWGGYVLRLPFRANEGL